MQNLGPLLKAKGWTLREFHLKRKNTNLKGQFGYKGTTKDLPKKIQPKNKAPPWLPVVWPNGRRPEPNPWNVPCTFVLRQCLLVHLLKDRPTPLGPREIVATVHVRTAEANEKSCSFGVGFLGSFHLGNPCYQPLRDKHGFKKSVDKDGCSRTPPPVFSGWRQFHHQVQWWIFQDPLNS